MEISRKNFIIVLVAVTVIKIIFAFSFPIKNDEASYFLWGQHFYSGNYDHPPMIGWSLYLMSFLSDSVVWLRTLAISSALVVTWVIYRFVLNFADENSARFAALLFVLSPLNILLFLVSNDAPLLIFSTLSALLFYNSLKSQKPSFAFLSGVLLGLAFLSKYFAVLIGIGYLVYALLQDRKRRLFYVGLVVAGAMPFVIQHIWYNYHNCWNTINFHFFVRNVGNPFDIAMFGFYIFGLLLVMTPWGIWYLGRNREKLKDPNVHFLVALVGTSALFFAFVSLKNVIGLHFFLVFAPYLFPLYALVDDPVSRRRMVLFSSMYAAFFVLLLAGLAAFPLSKMEGWKHHSDFVLGLSPAAICQELDKYSDKPMFASYYASASILTHTCKRPIDVLFSGSRYGREFDRWLDIRKLNGKTIAIFDVGLRRNKHWAKYFNRFRIDVIQVRKAPFTIFIGEGFKYEKYRDEFLADMRKRYYSPPEWLPQGGCYFNERYFPNEKKR